MGRVAVVSFSGLVSFIGALQVVSGQLSPGALGAITQVVTGQNANRAAGDNHPVGSLAGLAGGPLAITPQPVAGAALPPPTTARPPPTTTFAGFLIGQPYPFVMPPPDIPYFGSKWNGPWGYPIGHYQAFRGTGQYITHYSYYPLSYFGSLMAPFAYGLSGKK